MSDPLGPGYLAVETNNSVAVVLGTRPGIVKLAPVLRQLRSQGVPHFAVHSGQHYSENMDRIFFDDLGIALPEHRVGKRRPGVLQGEQTAEMLAGIERILVAEKPRVVLVGGDANTNLAGALAARKLGLLVGHVEAGLRSHDWRMPEEHNRVVIDHISDVLFASSELAKTTAEAEGVRGRIAITGSTIAEALKYSLAVAENDASARIPTEKYVVATLHRQENVDNPSVLRELCTAICQLPHKLGMSVRWPIHPRTRARLSAFGLAGMLERTHGLALLEPSGHIDFTGMLARASLVVTDSGGVQQEACILRVPCVTARPSTEWVETVEAGANLVAGTEASQIVNACVTMADHSRDWQDPFTLQGVNASSQIVKAVEEMLVGN